MENRIATISRTKEIISKHNFAFQKKYGQNFLIDLHVLDDIIEGAGVTKEDVVIEIGPGIGSLTQYIAEHAHKVYAVEIDKMLIPILKETLSPYDNVEIINQDILKLDLKTFVKDIKGTGHVKVIANLPYYITTPIIMALFESGADIESITVMIQKEVADRMRAKPSTKDYGALTLAVNYYSHPEIVTQVSPHAFIPKPNVGSTVIHLKRTFDHQLDLGEEKLLFRIIRAAFNQRRKTLFNGLKNVGNFDLTKDEIIEVIKSCEFNEKIRGEALSLEEFMALAKAMHNKISQ